MHITPNWSAPKNIFACTTTRIGGVSKPPYESFNLASHVGDDPADVEQNRAKLRYALKLPAEPMWLTQTHSTSAVSLDSPNPDLNADASYTTKPNIVCAVLTADCLPLLLCNKQGTEVAAIHAGWQGLQAGVIEATLDKINTPGQDLLVWLGPAIGPAAFQVKDDVHESFLAKDHGADLAFQKYNNDTWLGNMYLLAKRRLHARGVTNIYGGEFCTYNDPKRFYSFRRDGVTGRMGSIIYIHH